jgi:hypothetical protein
MPRQPNYCAPGLLIDYEERYFLRVATHEECARSARAAHRDEGEGVIDADGRRCTVIHMTEPYEPP